jgi:hypothetical protein
MKKITLTWLALSAALFGAWQLQTLGVPHFKSLHVEGLLVTPAEAACSIIWTTGVGTPLNCGGGGYTGPGDTISGATEYWGFNAYNAAYIGSKAANICDHSTGLTCSDVNIGSNGYIINSGISQCSVACEVATLYGQLGVANLTAPHGNRPAFTLSALNGHACATFTAASSEYLLKSTFTNISLPFTITAIVSAAALSTGTAQYISGASIGSGASGQAVHEFQASSAFARFQNNGAQAASATLSTSTFYAIQGVDNSTTAYQYTNGVQVSASGSPDPILSADPVFIGENPITSTDYLGGVFCGSGIWPIDFANTGSDAANMNTQMRASFGSF